MAYYQVNEDGEKVRISPETSPGCAGCEERNNASDDTEQDEQDSSAE